MARDSLQLRRATGGSELRPATGSPTEYSSALKSDGFYLPSDVNMRQTALVVEDIDSSTVRVSFNPDDVPVDPTFGAPQAAMIVKSTYGIPAHSLDGTEMRRVDLSELEAFNGGWVSSVDSPLRGGFWYYYALFAQYNDSGNIYWFRVGEASYLNPRRWGYPERMWRGIPEYYRKLDSEGAEEGLLHKIAYALGFEFDIHRTWAFTLGDVWDFARLGAQALPAASEALGQPMEHTAGDKRMRVLLSNLMTLRRMKGTTDGLEGYLTSITGYRVVAYSGLNLLLDQQHAEFTETWTTAQIPTVGVYPGWVGYVAAIHISRVVSGASTTWGPPNGVPYARFTQTSATATAISAAYGSSTTWLARMIPVKAGHLYRFSASLAVSAGTIAFTPSVSWYTAQGVFISTTTAANLSTTTTWSRLHTDTLTAPADAAFARFFLAATTTSAQNVWLGMYRPMFVDTAWRPVGLPYLSGTAPLTSAIAPATDYWSEDYYELPRTAYINVYPSRVNLAKNSAFLLDPDSVSAVEDAWAINDAPTYAMIPDAYEDYEDIPVTEDDYADLASELDPLIGGGSLDIGGGSMELTLDAAPYSAAVRSYWFPVLSTGGMSASIKARAIYGSGSLTMRMQWFTDNTPGTEVLDAGVPVVSSGPTYQMPGPAADGSVSFPGIVGNTLQVPDEAAFTPVDLTVVAHVRMADWTPGASQVIAGQFGTGEFSWYFYVNVDGKLNVAWSTDGSGTSGVFTSSVPLGYDDGTWKWIAVAFKVDDGVSARRYGFYHKDNEEDPWTLIGLAGQNTTGSRPPLFGSAAPITIGARANSGTALPMEGDVDYVAVYTDVAGVPTSTPMVSTSAPVFLLDQRSIPADSETSFAATTGQTVTVNRTGSPDLVLHPSTPTSSAVYTVTGAYPPAGAAFGRLSLDVTSSNGTRIAVEFQEALIEDRSNPGAYFDGTWTEGDFGDFFFANGAPDYEDVSVYYPQFRSFLQNPGGSDRVTALMADQLPPGIPWRVTMATNGLFPD